jgi:spermidine synthase
MDEFFSSCEYHLAEDGLFVLQVHAIHHLQLISIEYLSAGNKSIITNFRLRINKFIYVHKTVHLNP